MQAAIQPHTSPAFPDAIRSAASRMQPPDAIDLLSAVYGKPNVTLRGFKPSSAASSPWGHPGIQFVSAPLSPMDLVTPLQKASASKRWLQVATYFATACFTFSLGLLAAWASLDTTVVGATDNAKWSITRIEQRGVQLRAAGATVFIPVGDRLPNGDVLISVVPARDAVVMSSGTLYLRNPTKEARYGQ